MPDDVLRQIATHEASHAVVSRAVGSIVELVTIVPNGMFAGRCVRRGAPSQSLGLIDTSNQEPTSEELLPEEIAEVCEDIGPPQIGVSRIEFAEATTRAMTAIVELVAGRVGERIFFPAEQPLPAENDYVEAHALASIVCSPAAVPALIRFAEAEAEAIIRAHRGAVEALANALIDHGTIDGPTVDEIIVRAVDVENLTQLEHPRRKDMKDRTDRAEKFKEKNGLTFPA